MKLLVVDVVGLRPCDLDQAPRIRELSREGFMAPMETVFPALTCSVQATWLTGLHPNQHGIVANGWYFRDLAQVMFWRQANQLIQGEKVYSAAARQDPAFTCAKMFWWFNMYAPVEWSVTPRPEYWADGLKKPGLYSEPPELAGDLQGQLGAFPLFQFWGPGAGIASSRWIADASLAVMRERDPSLALVYLPHLDYDHQRFGPEDPRSKAAVAEVDREVGRLIDHARAVGAEVMILSEYGIEEVTRPIFINRFLHERGLLRVQETSHGQLLDAGASKAFAVADHQIAHLYLGAGASIADIKALVSGLEGVAEVLDREEQARLHIDHERSGDLLCIAAPGTWFAYHYWLEESRRPDFANTVDIHRKPGYDPTELFLDPGISFPKLRIVKNLLKKKLGFRYLMDVIGTDPGLVRGSHGRLLEDPQAGPLFISSSKRAESGSVHASEVSARILAALAP